MPVYTRDANGNRIKHLSKKAYAVFEGPKKLERIPLVEDDKASSAMGGLIHRVNEIRKSGQEIPAELTDEIDRIPSFRIKRRLATAGLIKLRPKAGSFVAQSCRPLSKNFTADESRLNIPRLEAVAISYAILTTGIEFVRRGFRKNIESLSPGPGEAFLATLDKFNFIPDSHAIVRIDGKPTELCILEVEDTCPLTNEKLWGYCQLSAAMPDGGDWKLRLFLGDRLGRCSELDLATMRRAFEMAAI